MSRNKQNVFINDFLAKLYAGLGISKTKQNGAEKRARNVPNTFLNHSAIQLVDNRIHRDFARGQKVTRYHLDHFRAQQNELQNIETCTFLASNIPYFLERL